MKEFEMYSCTCYHTFDFAAAQKRCCKDNLPIDDYAVELEDYENINDLIARSVRTKTKFVPEHDANAIYQSDEDIAQELQMNIDRSALADDDADKGQDAVEQSEDQSGLSSAETKDKEPTL